MTVNEMPDELIVLEDEDGNEIRVLFHDSFEVGDRTYAVLLDPDDEDESDGALMRVELDEHGSEMFVPIEDDAEWDAAVAAWAVIAAEDGEEIQ